MKKPLLIITLLTTIYGFSHHTERFSSFAKELNFMDSIHVIKKYKNGNLKETYSYAIYFEGEWEYEFPIGNESFYTKEGVLIYTRSYDLFGNVISETGFYKNGKIWFESKTTNIDTSASTIDLYYKKNKLTKVTSLEKYYYLAKDGIQYLYKSGPRLNNKKVGVWTTYCSDGSITKQKNHSKK